MVKEDGRAGDVSRPGTFLTSALRESPWVALDVPNAPDGSRVDPWWLGGAIADGAGALGILLSGTRPFPRTLLDRARHAVWLVRRWLPTRELVVVGDSAYAALAWLDAVWHALGGIARLRRDAALDEPAPPR
jgi:hypothetical protein